MANNAKITIKQNSQQLLVWLYDTKDEERMVQVEQTKQLWSHVTESGRRSLLHYLEKQLYIETTVLNRQKWLRLTNFGRKWVESYFAALNPSRVNWQGDWQLLILTNSVSKDPNFRRLRMLIGQSGGVNLERGIYLCAVPLSEQLNNELQITYRNCVMGWQVDQCVFGDEKMTIIQKSNILDLVNIYSGISNEVDCLIENINTKKISIDRRTAQVFKLYTQLWENLHEDSGFIYFFFKNEPNFPKILFRLQQLVI